MRINEVHEMFDHNWCRAMRELGFGVNTYQHWRKNGYIPMRAQLRIEEKTNGILRADLREHAEAEGKYLHG